MALSNNIDPARAAEVLAKTLARHLPGIRDVTVTDVEIPQASGLSNETLLFTAGWVADDVARQERLVARVQPSGPAIFPRYDFALEYSIMSALAERSNVPVPAMLCFERDPEPLGAPFMVMHFVAGTVPSDDPPFTVDGWVLELSPDQQALMVDNSIKALAALHTVDVEGIGLGALTTHREAGIDGQLQFWREFLSWAAEGDTNPTVEVAFAWLDERAHDRGGASVLTWGDARIGNLMFADDLSVAAVLDWEMAAIAPPEMDVAWWLFLMRHHSEGIGASLPPGFPTPQEFVARYQELSGFVLEDLHFWEVLAATKLSVLMHRAGNLMIASGLLPADAPMKLNNPASQLLAKLLGLPAPAGAAQSFIGNR